MYWFDTSTVKFKINFLFLESFKLQSQFEHFLAGMLFSCMLDCWLTFQLKACDCKEKVFLNYKNFIACRENFISFFFFLNEEKRANFKAQIQILAGNKSSTSEFRFYSKEKYFNLQNKISCLNKSCSRYKHPFED